MRGTIYQARMVFMIQRQADEDAVLQLMRIFPVTAILGARQCGKTTLARHLSFDHYFDLENTQDLMALDNAQLALSGLKGVIVIDEVQRKPDLFPLLRYLVDSSLDQKYVLLGSASPSLLRQSSESLAGRIGFHNMAGFSVSDVGASAVDSLWSRGGYPRSFLSSSDEDSFIWRRNYTMTFIERDIPQLGINIPSQTLLRFWMMLAHYHGQVINYSELSRSFGVSDHTVRRYTDLLENTFMIRVLQPWHSNMSKRLVKRPKIYFRDSGLFHYLFSIKGHDDLIRHPKLGASWEGFALEEVCRTIKKSPGEVFFWATHSGAECDLLWMEKGKYYGVEFKCADAPKITKSMLSAINDLSLEHLWVVYPGKQKYMLAENITVVPLESFYKEQR